MHSYRSLSEFLARSFNNVDDLPLLQILKKFKLSPEGPWLAGGAIRRTLSGQPLDSDFDLFFKNEEQMRATMASFECDPVSKSGTQATYLIPGLKPHEHLTVQCVHFQFYNTVEELLDSFDFTVTQFATDGVQLYCGEHALWDLARRRLAVNKVTFGTATVRRLIKYTKQGFYACSGALADILEQVVQDPSVIKRETHYID